MPPSRVMRSILPKQDVRVAGGVVLAGAARVARVVAAAVADADVEVAVLAEAQIPGVVVARTKGCCR